MALIGLDSVYVAKINEVDGKETYEAPVRIMDAVEATITPSIETGNVFADDRVKEVIQVFSQIEVAFTFADLGSDNYAMLLGKEKDTNGVIIEKDKDEAPYFALGFRSKKSNGAYRYYWLYKGRFNPAEESFATQQGTADYQTQPVTGTFIKRDDGKIRARVDSDDTSLNQSVIDNWFAEVYEENKTFA